MFRVAWSVFGFLGAFCWYGLDVVICGVEMWFEGLELVVLGCWILGCGIVRGCLGLG